MGSSAEARVILKAFYLCQALLLQHGLQLADDDVLRADVKVATFLIIARPPVDAAGLIKWRYGPTQSRHNIPAGLLTSLERCSSYHQWWIGSGRYGVLGVAAVGLLAA